MLLLVIIAIVTPLAAAAEASTCTAGFKDLGLDDDRCYYFSSDDASAGPESWTMAFVRCQTLGGQILSVKDPLHFYPMSVLVQQGGYDAWTGLLHVAGVLSWADESPYNPELDQFITNPSPTDIYGCISVADGLFHFKDGSEKLDYICYEDVSVPPTPTTTTPKPPVCPAGWEQFTDACYLFSSDAQFWTTAEHNCISQGAELVSIHDRDLFTFLLITAGEEVYWTGLHNEDTKYAWADGSTTDDIAEVVAPLLDDWVVGKDCVIIDQATYPKSLVHRDCFEQNKYMCYKAALESDEADSLDYSSLYWFHV